MKENLILHQKVYEFLLYMYPVINLYPKYEKFTLQTRTKNCMFDLLDSIEKANKSTTKKSAVYDVDLHLSKLRTLIRLAKDLHYFNLKKYNTISKMLSEIGSLVGGWIKWIQTTS